MALTTFVAGNVLLAQELNDSFANVGGQRMVKDRTAFTTVASVTADGVFSATFENYLVVVEYQTSGNAGLTAKFRASGTSSSVNYNYQSLDSSTTTTTSSRTTGATQALFGSSANGAFWSTSIVFIGSPFSARPTTFIADNTVNFAAYTAPELRFVKGNHNVATAHDGLELFISGGQTITGFYTIYGLGITGD